MGLMAGFLALGGFVTALALIVVWAGSLERWMDHQETMSDDLEATMKPAGPRVAAVNPASISLEPGQDDVKPGSIAA
jgi:hypothetical protein